MRRATPQKALVEFSTSEHTQFSTSEHTHSHGRPRPLLACPLLCVQVASIKAHIALVEQGLRGFQGVL